MLLVASPAIPLSTSYSRPGLGFGSTFFQLRRAGHGTAGGPSSAAPPDQHRGSRFAPCRSCSNALATSLPDPLVLACSACAPRPIPQTLPSPDPRRHPPATMGLGNKRKPSYAARPAASVDDGGPLARETHSFRSFGWWSRHRHWSVARPPSQFPWDPTLGRMRH